MKPRFAAFLRLLPFESLRTWDLPYIWNRLKTSEFAQDIT